MIKKILAPLVAIACILMGCQNSSNKNSLAQEKTLRINIGDDPASLDPRKARDLNSINMIRWLFDGLTRVNVNEEVELAIAERIEVSEDAKVYTFHLRRSKWTNGESVTAQDFAYAWKKVLSPVFPSSNAFQLYVIKNAKCAKEGKCSLDEVGIKVLDDYTLQVELDNPAPYFLELTALPVYFPVSQKNDEEHPKWADQVSTFVCNGPFSIESWKRHDQMILSKNGSYWDEKTVRIPHIQMVMLKEETAFQLFEKNELDWMGSPISVLPLDTLKILKAQNRLHVKPMLGTNFFRINTTKAPFNNPLIRKAFAIGINRQEIVEYVTQGGQIPATGLVPITMKLRPSAYFPDGDLPLANKLLKEGMQDCGMDLATLPEVTVTFISRERTNLVMQAIQEQWLKAFGIRVKLEPLESKVFFSRIGKQDFQIAFGDWTADFNDPINFLEVFKYKNGSSNNTCWENSSYAELLDQACQTVGEEKRRELLQQAEELLVSEMPIIPLYHTSMLFVKNNQLNQEALSSFGVLDFKWAFFEPFQEKHVK